MSRALVKSFCNMFGHNNGDNASRSIVEMAKEVDSSYVVTIRLLHRRWHDEKCSKDDDASSPLPSVDWKLFDSLHKTKVSGGQYDVATSSLCKHVKSLLSDDIVDLSWITKDAFDDTLERVVGCGYAVVDLTLNLGFQTIGRALFLEHSFYNHACNPNAFISCFIGGPVDATSASKSTNRPPSCALVSKVHCLADIKSGEDVTQSYIPTSGLDREERRTLLKDGYHFECQCRACRLDSGDATAEGWNCCLNVPEGSDLSSLREVQYSCNQSLLAYDDNDDDGTLDGCIGLIRMSANGIKNQGIASSHEVALEFYRLLATAYSLSGKLDEAVKEHAAFFCSVEKISDLFDPIALATQRAECAFVLQKIGSVEGEHPKHAESLLRVSLGSDHPYTAIITQKVAVLQASSCEADASESNM